LRFSLVYVCFQMLGGKEEQASLFTDLKKQVDDGNIAIQDLQKSHMEELGVLQQHIKELNECNLELEEHLRDAESRIQELGRVGQLKCERIEQKMTKQLENERKINKERIEKIETDTRNMLQKKITEVTQPFGRIKTQTSCTPVVRELGLETLDSKRRVLNPLSGAQGG
jgi:chromosome segregation ATPase